MIRSAVPRGGRSRRRGGREWCPVLPAWLGALGVPYSRGREPAGCREVPPWNEGMERATHIVLGFDVSRSVLVISHERSPRTEHLVAPTDTVSAHLAALSIGDRRSTESQVLAYSREWLLLSVIRSAVPRGGSSGRRCGGDSCPVLPPWLVALGVPTSRGREPDGWR